MTTATIHPLSAALPGSLPERSSAGVVPTLDGLPPAALARSFAHCRDLTRARARNFYWGLRLTPEPRRSAVYAMYAWMRRADDLADDSPSPEHALAALAEFRLATRAAVASASPPDADPLWPAFIASARAFGVDTAWLDAALDGMEQDARHAQPHTDDHLNAYCDRVASTVGLICVSIWGLRDGADRDRAKELSVRLGRAFQLTNILRDIRADAALNPPRVYLPKESFEQAGLTVDNLLAWSDPDRCATLVRAWAARAALLFEASRELETLIDPECRPAVAALSALYRALLARIDANPQAAVAPEPVRLPTARKLAIALRAARVSERARPSPPTPTPRRVLIAGGGIAGLAAAIRLAERGVAVTLLETRKKLGGRATSFTDPRTGETLDNCQHVAMGCCTNYLDFCRRLGVDHLFTWTDQQHWVEPGGRTTRLEPSRLPAPLHGAKSFMRAAFLTSQEKTAIRGGLKGMLLLDPADHHDRSAADLLSWLRQPESVVRKFWAPVIVSACNAAPEHASAAATMKVFREGILAGARASSIGLSRVPLMRLYDHAEGLIRQSGGRLLLGAGVERLGETWALARLAGEREPERLEADAVVCALPFERVSAVIDPEIASRDERFERLSRLRTSPILGVHLVFDAPVLTVPHAVLVDRPTQWLFRKDQEGRALHAVVSAADEWMELDEPAIVERVLADVRACMPWAAHANLVSSRAVKEKRATFLCEPGVDRLRPGPVGQSGRGPILAGDYVATGWPATMESAARSGYMAAACVLGLPPHALLAPDLRPGPLLRAVMRS